ncbi:MAG: PQQ-binding-like beta-propeller repeat protein [Anaerolineaceae bacterium]|nr:PQQ-binding-like beta-propeller repeat protein [Anaerolineaceae bacterium]
MSTVYCARDLHFKNAEKLVAIKEMINRVKDPSIQQTIVKNFEREANILVTLSHISIPKIFDFFSQDNRFYLVLEYIRGKDLDVILDEADRFLPIEQVLSWAIELCDVLEFLHSHLPEPIIFRDLKPSNLMINNQNRVVLIDFGIAKNFETGKLGTIIGTEGYSPPEQYRGQATHKADIYSLGATLHHLLSRRDPRLEPPFSFSERPIQDTNPSVSDELEAIIERSLQYNPEDRFNSVREMKAELIKLSHAYSNQIPELPGLSVQTQSEVGKELWVYECGDEIRGSPYFDNGVVYFGSYDCHLYALNADKGKILWRYKTENGIVGQPVVQDGIVYFGSEDHRLFAVSTRTGKLSWVFEANGPIRSSPRIAEGHVFVGSDSGFLHAVNLATSRQVWSVEASGPIRSSPLIIGGNVIFGCETGDVFCFNFRGQNCWRFRAKRAVTSSPTANKNIVYFASLDGLLYAIDLKTSWTIWQFRMGKGSISSPCISGNRVFVGSADGCIYAVDAGNASEIWKFQAGRQISGSPSVRDGAVYCGSADGTIYCLDEETGDLRWKFITDGPITGTPVFQDDRLYIGSFDHKFYAIRISIN